MIWEICQDTYTIERERESARNADLRWPLRLQYWKNHPRDRGEGKLITALPFVDVHDLCKLRQSREPRYKFASVLTRAHTHVHCSTRYCCSVATDKKSLCLVLYCVRQISRMCRIHTTSALSTRRSILNLSWWAAAGDFVYFLVLDSNLMLT